MISELTEETAAFCQIIDNSRMLPWNIWHLLSTEAMECCTRDSDVIMKMKMMTMILHNLTAID